MNNRFKFRAWNKQENMYHYNAECAYDSMGGTPPLMDDSFNGVLCNDDYVVEQSTGLTDKNGKLIYEGDVLRFASQIDVCVTFRNGGFVYSLTEDEKLAYRFTEVIAKETQIIGNIHDDQFREVTKLMEGEQCD